MTILVSRVRVKERSVKKRVGVNETIEREMERDMREKEATVTRPETVYS